MWQAPGIDVRLSAALYAAAWVTTLWYLGLYTFRVRWTIAAELLRTVPAVLGRMGN